MVTRAKIVPLRVYLAEHMADKEVGDQDVADKIGYDRVTVTRWRSQQDRLDPTKIAQLAAALGLDDPRQLFSPPDRPSLDAMVQHAPEDVQAMAVDIVRRLVARQ